MGFFINENIYIDHDAIPTEAPLYPQAIALPALSFPGWILCLSPIYWHLKQGNIAVGSLILWITLNMVFISINTLIWPRDNLLEWWDGAGWCDINVRIQIGVTVGLPSCAIMILHKLVKVLNTHSVTVSSSRNSKLMEKTWSIVWCWLYPVVLICLYDIPEGYRYFIFGIRGCVSAYYGGWPGMVLSQMWGPITCFVAACYAGLLIYRLYRYRREFSRLIAARNTTKSKFFRLFLISMIVVGIYFPYAVWQFLQTIGYFTVIPYSWQISHSQRHIIAFRPVAGQIGVDGWLGVFTCYIIFLVFGIGAEANSQYKQILRAMGFDKIFPSLYRRNDSRSSSPSSFIKSFRSRMSSTAKSVFGGKSMEGTFASTVGDTTRNESIQLSPRPTLGTLSTEPTPKDKSFSPFRRLFPRRCSTDIEFNFPDWDSSTAPINRDAAQPAANSSTSVVETGARTATEPSSTQCLGEVDGVRIFREVSQERADRIGAPEEISRST